MTSPSRNLIPASRFDLRLFCFSLLLFFLYWFFLRMEIFID